jgi:vacuolar-type H+-ATPase subunit E/Vma4
MNDVKDPDGAALEPLRAALIARAHAEADRVCAAAEADGQRVLAAARKNAAQLLSDARAQGEADAAALLAVEAASARRAARGVLLAAQRAAYDELRQRARTSARALLDDRSRRARLTAVVRDRLGEHAVVREHPDGGLLAETPDGRRVDASIDTLVDIALAQLDLEPLWAAS